MAIFANRLNMLLKVHLRKPKMKQRSLERVKRRTAAAYYR